MAPLVPRLGRSGDASHAATGPRHAADAGHAAGHATGHATGDASGHAADAGHAAGHARDAAIAGVAHVARDEDARTDG